MEVGTKDILIMNTFADFFFVISISIDNLSQRILIILDDVKALMIFKTIVDFIEIFIVNLDVPDKTVIGLVERVVAHDP